MNLLLCIFWGQQTIPSQKRLCACGKELALSMGNVQRAEELKAQPICFECVARLLHEEPADPDLKFGGGLLNGKVYPTLEGGIQAAQSYRNRN